MHACSILKKEMTAMSKILKKRDDSLFIVIQDGSPKRLIRLVNIDLAIIPASLSCIGLAMGYL